MPSFACATCEVSFSVPQGTLDRFPGWTPRRCRSCRPASGGAATGASKASSAGPKTRGTRGLGSRASAREENLSVAEVLARYTKGPQDGVFTDGSADPNPGPGGWGAVYVVGGQVVDELDGHDPATTNNRMELTALVAAYRLVPEGAATTVWTDSNLCVQTINQWARGWAAAGWKRKTGPIANLDLVQELYGLHQARPELHLQWIKAHDGSRWNEYADALATAYRRARR